MDCGCDTPKAWSEKCVLGVGLLTVILPELPFNCFSSHGCSGDEDMLYKSKSVSKTISN